MAVATRPRRKSGSDRPTPRYTLGPVVAQFFERRLRHVQGPLAGRPVVLEPWQRADIDLIFEVDAKGNRVWQRVLYGLPRGNGKTPIVGGIGLRELVRYRDSPRVFNAAGARDQAKLLHEFIRPQVEPGRVLSDFCVPRVGSILAPRGGGVMRVLSADGDLQHGLNVSFAGIDELHVFKTTKQVELYNALATALKRPHSWEMSITTAGKSKQTLLGYRYDAALKKATELYVGDQGCLTIAARRDARSLMIWRGLPDDGDPADESLWGLINAASWIDMGYLRTQAMTLPAGVFRRLHLNQWSEGTDTAIPGPSWDACAERGVSIPDGEDVFLAVALSERTDSGVLCAVGRPRGDGRQPVVFVVVPPTVDGGSASEMLSQAVRDAATRWRVVNLAFNPLHFQREAADLRAEGIDLWKPDGATDYGFREVDDAMGPASRDTLSAVVTGGLVHEGDPLVREQIVSAVATVRRNVWRIARPRREDVSDLAAEAVQSRAEAAIALTMAYATANGDDPVQPWAAAW